MLEISLHPAGFRPFVELCDVDFCEDILDSLENKVQIRETDRGALSNRILSASAAKGVPSRQDQELAELVDV